MRGVVAKRLRRQVYGCGHHIGDDGKGPVRYFVGDLLNMKAMPRNLNGCCLADQPRRNYQYLKRAHTRNRVQGPNDRGQPISSPSVPGPTTKLASGGQGHLKS